MTEKLIRRFFEIFGGERLPRCFFAGGRINLIGEHTDYNGGHVFPCALTMGTYCLLRPRVDSSLRMYSENFPETGMLSCKLDAIEKDGSLGWGNYVLGMLFALKEKGITLPKGFDLLLYGNIPNGAGLSSSASLEVAVGEALRSSFRLSFSNVELALMGQRAENGFIGVNTGIMDQFAIAMGQPKKAVFLDTATLKYSYVPLELKDYSILIMNTKKQRGLGESKYNERRSQCEHALKQLQTLVDTESLGALTPEQFEACKQAVADPVERKRAKHAVYENARTLQGLKALERGDLTAFGRLVDESHISLRDDYEVSCTELDTLVEAAREQQGVIGARMVGGGFGGCAIAIAKTEGIQGIIEAVQTRYTQKIGHEAEFYIASVGGGPRELMTQWHED